MFTQYDVYTSTSYAVVNVNFGLPITTSHASTTAPLQGTASLQMKHWVNSGRANLRPNSSIGNGFAKGTIRTQFSPNSATAIAACGLYCLAESANLTANTGACYLVGFDNHGGSASMWLDKSPSGVGRSIGTRLSGTTFAWVGASFTLGLTWRVSSSQLTIQVQRGSNTSFTDMTTIFSYTDTSSYLSTSVGEGFWTQADTSPSLLVIADRTLFQKHP